MLEFLHISYQIIIWAYLIYGTAVFLVYSWIGIYALGAVVSYNKQNIFTDYNIIASSPNAPTFTIIAPAYNEGFTIVENVRSLLSLYYENLEIIIVNDGSKDDSMAKLIKEYELESISFFVLGTIETNEVRGIYKSKNAAFKKLIVVDKENGGKADALNVGVNISSGEYLVCVDVDCILEQDAILKLSKPFLQQTDKKLIACGGVIRLANNCKIQYGKITDANIPKTLLGKTQALEYIRAFILGRMAWSRASGLILISGAFGVFDREIVLAVGGYDRNTVGEDMELVVRMRKYMEDLKQPYEVITIPDPLCWTEAPETKEILIKQRNRWMRGTMETLWKHRKLMFNPKYGKLGMISLPYWLLFEFLGPLVEFSGYIFFIIFLLLGIINWPIFLVLLTLVMATGFLFSIYGILVDLVSYQVYAKRKDFFKLIGTAMVEPFYFHPMIINASIKGFIAYFKKSNDWGEMTRQGFNQTIKNLTFKQKILAKLQFGLKKWAVFAIVFLILFLIGNFAELAWYYHKFPALNITPLAENLTITNLIFGFKFIFVSGIIYLILNFLAESWAKILVVVVSTTVVVSQYLLFTYFSESHNTLGADLWYYSNEEMKQILLASGMLNFKNYVFGALLIASALVPFWMAAKFTFKSAYIGIILLLIGLFGLFIPKNLHLKNFYSLNDFGQNAAKSKWSYFFSSNLDDYISSHPEIADLWGNSQNFQVNAEMINKSFPFWRKENTPDFLGPQFNKSDKVPNLVFVIVEGLGHAYSSPNGYVGNFTPFVDSLAGKSLYWENNLSSAGRTFGVLPSITGSLPFGKNGFLEIDKTPENFNLYTILKANGFQTGFFYGGNSDFDKTKQFLEYSKVDQIIDEFSYKSPPYQKLPASVGGESWGFDDQALFQNMQKVQKPQQKPYFDIILTISTHNPFLINNSAYYEKMYNERINSNQITVDQKKWALDNKKQLVSVLNLDDALKHFINDYKKRPDFKNTIFLITGDHSMPEITIQSKIDRFHVPLIIYSPLLKEPKHFKNIVSHFDVAPSFLAYYRNNYKIATPSTVTWVGRGLSDKPKTDNVGIPMMQSKNQLIDYVFGQYHLQNNQLYKLNNLTEDVLDYPSILKKVEANFKNFENKNSQFFSTKKLMPDSVIVNFMKKTKPLF
jgi:cellulose synthase/poly-beta-1,6-N-acetylglucosamine synthase-like glycosyltransferase/phosphoglycerol transferase MdoB-like AlkP superfamily enzyme